MDNFEKDYFVKLKQLATDYPTQRRDLAKSRIKMFVAAVYRQITNEKENFDLLVAAGNSGLFMMVITKMVYEQLEKEIPKTLTIPIYRFKSVDGQTAVNDNANLQKFVFENIDLIPKSDLNILFVDDETMTGLTVKESLSLLIKALATLESLQCTLISEHHFFEWHYHLPKVSLNYFAYSRLIQGLNGNIGYFIPEALYNKLTEHVSDVASYNHAMSIVIGGALKRKDNNDTPFFDTSITETLAHTIPNFNEQRQDLIGELKDLIIQSIDDYNNKTITFRF